MEVDYKERHAIQTQSAKNLPAEVKKTTLNFKMYMLKAAIAARQSEVTYLLSRLRRYAIMDKVVNIIHKHHDEVVRLHNVPTSAATPDAPSSGALSYEIYQLSQDIYIYETRVVDIGGGMAIAELENAVYKMKLKDAAIDPQQRTAITKDMLADTVTGVLLTHEPTMC